MDRRRDLLSVVYSALILFEELWDGSIKAKSKCSLVSRALSVMQGFYRKAYLADLINYRRTCHMLRCYVRSCITKEDIFYCANCTVYGMYCAR